MESLPLLSKYAHAYQGISTGDVDRYRRQFWELILPETGWSYFRSTVSEDTHFSGCQHAVRHWGDDGSHFAALARGEGCPSKRSTGVSVSQMRHLPASLYLGERFDGNVSAIIPVNPEHVGPISEYCFSKDYKTALRKIDKTKNITNATLTKVPFDIEKWQFVFESKYPNGIPLPISNDPTQWLFHGHPSEAREGTTLHVGLARLCGYRWPSETDSEIFLSDEARAWIAKAGVLPACDNDGLIGIPAVAARKATRGSSARLPRRSVRRRLVRRFGAPSGR